MKTNIHTQTARVFQNIFPCDGDVMKGNNLDHFNADTLFLWPTQTLQILFDFLLFAHRL